MEDKHDKTTQIELLHLSELSKHFNHDGYAVLYLDNKILVGNFSQGQFVFYNNEQPKIEFIQKMRIFNTQQEIYCWRSNGKLKGRLKIDDNCTANEYVDADQILFGTDLEKLNNGYCKLKEERGMEIIMPDLGFTVNAGKKRVAIKTRNYIDYTNNWQATYVDCRFVEFVQAEV